LVVKDFQILPGGMEQFELVGVIENSQQFIEIVQSQGIDTGSYRLACYLYQT